MPAANAPWLAIAFLGDALVTQVCLKTEVTHRPFSAETLPPVAFRLPWRLRITLYHDEPLAIS